MNRVERMTRGTRAFLRGVSVVLVLVSSGCTCGGDADTQLMIFAASSLTDGFAACEAAFEAAHPGIDVVISTAGSQSLRLQIEQGADADVFASANPAHLDSLVEGQLVLESLPFVANALVIAIPDDNPASIASVEDLRQAERLVIGAQEVPIGRYTREFLARAEEEIGLGFSAAVLDGLVSEEGNVRLVTGKVQIGEADAAIVYRTDAASREGVSIVEIPESMFPRAQYRIGVVSESTNPDLAAAWVTFVTIGPGLEILTSQGFLIP